MRLGGLVDTTGIDNLGCGRWCIPERDLRRQANSKTTQPAAIDDSVSMAPDAGAPVLVTITFNAHALVDPMLKMPSSLAFTVSFGVLIVAGALGATA
jgi:hypothetical protein